MIKVNQNNKNNHLIENNDILDVNIMKENKDNNKTDENEIEKEENIYIEKNNNNDNKNRIIELNGNNNNINGINHELNEKENYESKDIIIDNIIKEDNKTDENNIRNKEIGNTKNKNYKLYSIDELKDKRKKKEIGNAFKVLSKNIIGNKELADLPINEINSKEILKCINNSNLMKISLMDEESSKKLKVLLNYELLNEFINSDNKKKNYLIENNHEEFNKIYNILSGKIELPNEIKIIDKYINCNKIMEMNKKFKLFGKIKHFNKEKNDFIYYFTFKNNSYIFFPEEMRVAKLKLNNDLKNENLFYLEEYIENKNDFVLSYINKIYSVGQNNTNITIKNNQIKYYYLINKKWLDLKLQEYFKIYNNNEIKISNEYNFETISPKFINTIFHNIYYPIDFYLIDKEEYSFEIKELSNIFKSEALPEYKIFFVYDNNAFKGKQKNIYFVIIDNLFIYFYLKKNNEFEIEFIVKYKKEEIMFKEIKNNIISYGIEVYLNIMGNNYENNNIKQKSLYDLDLNKIGFYININNKEINNIKFPEYPKSLEYTPNTYFYCGVIQCLLNIKIFRDIFLNKQFLIESKLIENSLITKKLYQIFQDKWYWANNKEIDISLIYDINNEDINIFKNCKLLIEFLLLHIHNENRKEKNFIKLDSLRYKSKEQIEKKFYINNNTIIRQLFFFETLHYYFCSRCECGDYVNYSINCILELESEINKKEIKIYDLLDNLSQMKDCEICKTKTLKSEKKFNSCPQFLIIVIKHNNKLKCKFLHIEKINLKNYITQYNYDSNEYNLISFIKNPPIEKEKKDGIIYCKSPVNKEWYKYEGLKNEKTNINDIIKNEKSIPYLLIYQNKCIDE